METLLKGDKPLRFLKGAKGLPDGVDVCGALFYSDQDCLYTSPLFEPSLQGFIQSMSGRWNCRDSACMERNASLER